MKEKKPTTIIKTMGSASRQYSTYAALAAAMPANIATKNEIWHVDCYNDSELTAPQEAEGPDNN
ncbi:MAG: hypothetical protein ABIY63_13285 [Fibrobacteria bacterium]